jgi:hypothetical protein
MIKWIIPALEGNHLPVLLTLNQAAANVIGIVRLVDEGLSEEQKNEKYVNIFKDHSSSYSSDASVKNQIVLCKNAYTDEARNKTLLFSDQDIYGRVFFFVVNSKNTKEGGHSWDLNAITEIMIKSELKQDLTQFENSFEDESPCFFHKSSLVFLPEWRITELEELMFSKNSQTTVDHPFEYIYMTQRFPFGFFPLDSSFSDDGLIYILNQLLKMSGTIWMSQELRNCQRMMPKSDYEMMGLSLLEINIANVERNEVIKSSKYNQLCTSVCMGHHYYYLLQNPFFALEIIPGKKKDFTCGSYIDMFRNCEDLRLFIEPFMFDSTVYFSIHHLINTGRHLIKEIKNEQDWKNAKRITTRFCAIPLSFPFGFATNLNKIMHAINGNIDCGYYKEILLIFTHNRQDNTISCVANADSGIKKKDFIQLSESKWSFVEDLIFNNGGFQEWEDDEMDVKSETKLMILVEFENEWWSMQAKDFDFLEDNKKIMKNIWRFVESIKYEENGFKDFALTNKGAHSINGNYDYDIITQGLKSLSVTDSNKIDKVKKVLIKKYSSQYVIMMKSLIDSNIIQYGDLGIQNKELLTFDKFESEKMKNEELFLQEKYFAIQAIIHSSQDQFEVIVRRMAYVGDAVLTLFFALSDYESKCDQGQYQNHRSKFTSNDFLSRFLIKFFLNDQKDNSTSFQFPVVQSGFSNATHRSTTIEGIICFLLIMYGFKCAARFIQKIKDYDENE